MSTEIPDITLPKDLSFTRCFSQETCRGLNKINVPKNALAVVHINPDRVIAYSGDDNKSCTEPELNKCKFIFEFKGAELASLISKTNNPDAIKQALKPPPPVSSGDTRLGQQEGQPFEFFKYALDLLGNSLGPIGILSLIVLATGLSAKYLLRNKRHSQPSPAKRKRSSSDSPLAMSEPLDNMYCINPEILNQLKAQQATLINQNIELSNRVSKIESEMLGLLQQQQLASLRLERVTQPPSPQPSATQVPRVEHVVPQSLTIDVIKQAVLTNDYSLLSSYPHDFLTETDRSRQGIEESKRFQIDGNSSQANGRPQSEFIAIICCGSTYLIPNIVPNCSDPARTIKRLSDMNNIYKRGQGENYLMIKELAEVQKTGSFYELSKDGRIA